MADLVISLLLIAFSIGYIALTARLPPAVGVTVGPKGFPLLVATLLIAASLVLLWQALRSPARSDQSAPPPAGVRRGNLILVVAAAVSYVFVLKFAGYVVSTFLFLAAVLLVWNRGRPLLNLAIAMGSAICAYLLISMLQISLPGGALGLP